MSEKPAVQGATSALENAIEVPKEILSTFSFGGTNFWDFLTISALVWLIFIFIKPIRSRIRNLLRQKFYWIRDARGLHFLSGYWSWVAMGSIVFLTYGVSLYVGKIMSIIEPITYFFAIWFVYKKLSKLIDRHFESLAIIFFGGEVDKNGDGVLDRNTNYKVVGNFPKAFLFILALIGVLSVFTVSLNDLLSLNLPNWVGAAIAASVVYPTFTGLSGVLILAKTNPCRAGDLIKIEKGESAIMGTFVEAGIYFTKLIGYSGETITIANKKLESGDVTNYSTRDKQRVKMKDILLAVNNDAVALREFVESFSSYIDKRKFCKVAFCRFEDGLPGYHRLIINYDILLNPVIERLLVDQIQQEVQCDMVSIMRICKVTPYTPHPLAI